MGVLTAVLDPIVLVVLIIGVFATRSGLGVIVAAGLVLVLQILLVGPPPLGAAILQTALLVAVGFGLRWVRWKLWPPRKT
jgi:hypothetical protein